LSYFLLYFLTEGITFNSTQNIHATSLAFRLFRFFFELFWWFCWGCECSRLYLDNLDSLLEGEAYSLGSFGFDRFILGVTMIACAGVASATFSLDLKREMGTLLV